MKVLVFHTTDSIYATHAELCRKSMERFLDDIHLETIEPGNWLLTVNFKVDFLLRMRRQFRGPLLYVDADAFVHEDVTSYFSALKEDIAVCYLDGAEDEELLSGTLYLNDTPATLAVLEEWFRRTEDCKERFDQVVLQEVVDDFVAADKVAIHRLPPEYCFIFDSFRETFPGVRPLIEHLQASRELRFLGKENTLLRRLFGVNKKVSRRLRHRREYMQQLAAQVGCEVVFNDRDTSCPMTIRQRHTLIDSPVEA